MAEILLIRRKNTKQSINQDTSKSYMYNSKLGSIVD